MKQTLLTIAQLATSSDHAPESVTHRLLQQQQVHVYTPGGQQPIEEQTHEEYSASQNDQGSVRHLVRPELQQIPTIASQEGKVLQTKVSTESESLPGHTLLHQMPRLSYTWPDTTSHASIATDSIVTTQSSRPTQPIIATQSMTTPRAAVAPQPYLVNPAAMGATQEYQLTNHCHQVTMSMPNGSLLSAYTQPPVQQEVLSPSSLKYGSSSPNLTHPLVQRGAVSSASDHPSVQQRVIWSPYRSSPSAFAQAPVHQDPMSVHQASQIPVTLASVHLDTMSLHNGPRSEPARLLAQPSIENTVPYVGMQTLQQSRYVYTEFTYRGQMIKYYASGNLVPPNPSTCGVTTASSSDSTELSSSDSEASSISTDSIDAKQRRARRKRELKQPYSANTKM